MVAGSDMYDDNVENCLKFYWSFDLKRPSDRCEQCTQVVHKTSYQKITNKLCEMAIFMVS